MPSVADDTPVWFLITTIMLMGGAVSVLFGYFLWSIKAILTEIKDSLKELFNKHDDHESRLSKLEGKCAAQHSD